MEIPQLEHKLFVRNLVCAILILGFIGSSQVMAESLEITPFIGTRLGGDLDVLNSDSGRLDLEVDEGRSYGLLLGFPIYRGLRTELIFSRQETELKNDAGFLTQSEKLFDVKVDYYHLGASWEWAFNQFRPFAGVSLGATRFHPNDNTIDNETRFSFSAGGGAKIILMDNLGIRLEGRYFSTLIEEEDEFLCNSRRRCYRHEDSEYLHQFELRAGLAFLF